MNLKILQLQENPSKLESAMLDQQGTYHQNEQVKTLLDSIFLEPDRDRAFLRFLQTKEFQMIVKLLTIFQVSTSERLCEIGGGAGFLSWALSQTDFNCVDLLEPSCEFVTGTGYLRARLDHKVNIYTDLELWHEQAAPYNTIITKNCIHHFKNISMVAGSIRQKIKPGGRWFAFREQFADSPQELYKNLKEHPFSQLYDLYEWYYPAYHYVENIEITGFKLIAVIPFDYANNCLGSFSEAVWPDNITKLTNTIDSLLIRKPQKTVKNFWKEVKKNKLKNGNLRFYTRPQLMIFERIEI